MSGGVNTPIAAGTQIKLILDPVTNPTRSNQPESIIVTSYTDDSFIYSYDENSEGLVPTYSSYAIAQIMSAAVLASLLIGFELFF